MWFEILTAVVMKGSFFWDKLPVVRWKWTKVSEEHMEILLATGFKMVPFQVYFLSWKWKSGDPPKRRLTFNRLYAAIAQKIEPYRNLWIPHLTENMLLIRVLRVCILRMWTVLSTFCGYKLTPSSGSECVGWVSLCGGLVTACSSSESEHGKLSKDWRGP